MSDSSTDDAAGKKSDKAKRKLRDFSLEPTNAQTGDPETADERSGSQDRRKFYEEQRPPHYGE